MERGVPIRSVSRSIAVLQCINRSGSLSMMDIAREARLPYATAFRIIQTLMHEGLVASEPVRKHYHATCKIESLAGGYRDTGRLADLGYGPMAELTRRVGWPLTLSSAVGGSIVIRTCTHDISTLSFSQYFRGESFPMLDCAPGHVHLAFADDATRAGLLQGLEDQRGPCTTLAMFRSGLLTKRIREAGYASYDRTVSTKNPGKTSSFSVPVMLEDGKLAHLTMNLFATALPMSEAVKRYLDDLKQVAETIRQRLWSDRHPDAAVPAARAPEADAAMATPPLPPQARRASPSSAARVAA